jgi:hypothetical protein
MPSRTVLETVVPNIIELPSSTPFAQAKPFCVRRVRGASIKGVLRCAAQVGVPISDKWSVNASHFATRSACRSTPGMGIDGHGCCGDLAAGPYRV